MMYDLATMIGQRNIDKGQWWGKSLTLVQGCTPCGPACDNCWSAAMHYRFNPKSYLVNGPHWNGLIEVSGVPMLASGRRKTPTLYVIWNDLFHPNVSRGDRLCAMLSMSIAPQHIYLALTKRIEKAQAILRDMWSMLPSLTGKPMARLPNLGVGLTIWDQESADKYIPILAEIDVAFRFVCYEPMLGSVEFPYAFDDINWLIAGYETGPRARPGPIGWAIGAAEQCRFRGVPFWYKGRVHDDDYKRLRSKEHELDGKLYHEVPTWPT